MPGPSPDMLPDTPLPETWWEAVRLFIALVTGTVGTKLLDTWIKRSETQTAQAEKKQKEDQAREDKEEADRAQYEKDWREELRKENREIRLELRELEKKYNECEDDRAVVRSDLYMLRNKVQYLELRLAMQEPPAPAKESKNDSPTFPLGEVMRLKMKK